MVIASRRLGLASNVSIQAQIFNLHLDAQEKQGLTYLFVVHDISVVEYIFTRVAVMDLGTVYELADTAKLFSSPRSPYTQALLSAIPCLGRKRQGHVRLQ